jgi:hypothetical protein
VAALTAGQFLDESLHEFLQRAHRFVRVDGELVDRCESASLVLLLFIERQPVHWRLAIGAHGTASGRTLRHHAGADGDAGRGHRQFA